MSDFPPVEHHEQLGDRYEHPTFGTLRLSRSQGTPRPLFGSSILHQHTIIMEINTAHLWRDLNRDSIHGNKLIVEAEMSPTQFADAITSLNSGEVPITLRYVTGQGLIKDDPPYQNKVQQFNQEFARDLRQLVSYVDDVISLANEAKAQKRLVKALEQLKMRIESNLPFVNHQFSEQMEHTITEAKGEVEAFVTGMVKQYGMEAIRQQSPQIAMPETKQITEGEDNNA